YRTALSVTGAGLLGSLLGTYLNGLVSPRLLAGAFAALMLLAAALMLRRKGAARRGAQSLARLLGAGTVIGTTTGFFGVGGGFVIVPALVALGLPMRQAVPTSLLVIVLNSLVALAARVAAGAPVPLLLALPMIAGGAVGSALAVRLAPRLGNQGLTRAFAILVLALAAVMAREALVA
ncbi:MAG TPA: TSUP family transporter, partial [Deinococcales bacterium]|nr:TSUP family transporter [Deinococcales bacterium]